ncbi:MAG: hypothetical protein LBG72_10430 [Spirochaetaceae bacterium]|jgi:hypothetical protein|nr:hypothetical protein [Spirochaetaceae bacterium]
MERSSTAQVIIAIIPIVGIVMGSVVVFFYLLWNYKRSKLLIQTRQYSRTNFSLRLFSLLAGLLLGVTGVCLTVFLSLLQGLSYSLLGGIIPLSCGIALLAYFYVCGKAEHIRHHP